ncbi:hypothetical protein MTZ49_06295 [Entomomonas sp. E2T0]|uniref:PP0621 family protein n=1 Tax=Entomomonas sp. E2T0 TaxID=2930213 RepID=UPI0022283054|nr:PP0621 family protein [Entomomonas sp. E2T0]UYZ85160.1 hypothetical protein MTZ49_06295 [Entomomonas sp. E2T0]
MLRLLFFLAVGFGIYFLWLHIQKIKKQANQTPTDDTEPMVKCSYCDIYSPQKNAIKGSNNQWYCCTEHARKAEK